ncbi:ORF57 [White spot syndrome virus]|uniref:ORF57 n=1 Tax=White spot syndrome virus TaxID=342409 RepID=A0A2D3I690_9VIRU|nr:ORF57 [White spot syndrome virus]
MFQKWLSRNLGRTDSRNVSNHFWNSHFWKGLQFLITGALFLAYILAPLCNLTLGRPSGPPFELDIRPTQRSTP